MGCAQCHDHKYDPITQKEFYQLFAFFNNAAEVDIEAPLAGEYGPYLQALPEYRRQRSAILKKFGVLPLQAAWEEQMKQAADSQASGRIGIMRSTRCKSISITGNAFFERRRNNGRRETPTLSLTIS